VSAARDRAIAALARNHEFAQRVTQGLRGHTAAVLVSGDNAIAVMLPGPTRGRVVVAFQGELTQQVVITGDAARRLFAQ